MHTGTIYDDDNEIAIIVFETISIQIIIILFADSRIVSAFWISYCNNSNIAVL